MLIPRNPQKAAGICQETKPQIGVCPLRFIPLSAALALRGTVRLSQPYPHFPRYGVVGVSK